MGREDPSHISPGNKNESVKCISSGPQISFGGSVVKNSPANEGDAGSLPWLGRSPGEGNGNPLQDSRLGNPMGREAWGATVYGVAKSRMLLSD